MEKLMELYNNLDISFSELANTLKLKKLNEYKNIKNWNDPSAGSPMETLLRLLLPLNN
ncbi:hypothetical protein BCR32DRAFT_276344 [Anaeromyces robustus]|uniref:Uncharacterized protein n=1 Tax=Anaeromyces robustus TaxID=1754192 RepID=A0A1Y1XHT7_9FUNG|nr:hypothetical protein BCR32DRAFT_276344 [Anaeromyces robustus]|eukprot:ORX85309.1 hypothetical protein BCR32DRAFT_276344 [Anaeromyces robustus]